MAGIKRSFATAMSGDDVSAPVTDNPMRELRGEGESTSVGEMLFNC